MEEDHSLSQVMMFEEIRGNSIHVEPNVAKLSSFGNRDGARGLMASY